MAHDHKDIQETKFLNDNCSANMVAVLVAQGPSLVAPAWSELMQFGATGAIAFVLLWFFLQDRKDMTRALRATSIAMITFQQMLLVTTLSRASAGKGETSCEECTRLELALTQIQSVIEQQRITLERELNK